MGQALKELGVTLLKRHNRQHNFSYLNFNFKKYFTGTSLVVQWFKISPSTVAGAIPGQGAKIPHALEPAKKNTKT